MGRGNYSKGCDTPKGGKENQRNGKGKGGKDDRGGNDNYKGYGSGSCSPAFPLRLLESGEGICWNPADCDESWTFLGQHLLRGRRQASFNSWCGCRATKALAAGRGAFAVKNETGGNMRVGWSLCDASLELGKDAMSFGYGGTAMKSNAGKFAKYGQTYGQNDVIVALLDLDRHAISYMKNGHVIPGDAFAIPQSFWGQPFFPHVLTKEATITAYFGGPSCSFETPSLPVGFAWLANLQLARSSRECDHSAVKVEDANAIINVDTSVLEQASHRDQFEAWKVKVNNYAKHFQQPLHWEYEAERQSVMQRVKRAPKQLESTGFGCFGLSAELADQRIFLTRPHGIPRLAEISIGRTVLITEEENIVNINDVAMTIAGEVRNITERSIVLSTTYDRLPEGDTFRLDLGPNTSTYERIDRVLDKLQSCEKPSKKVKNRMGIMSPCTELADAIFADVAETSGAAMRWDPSTRPKPNPKSDIAAAARVSHLAVPLRAPQGECPESKQLNATQMNAKDMVIKECRRLSIIQGPPGTGKTTTAIEIIIGWLKCRKGPILATAFSNKGVNNLAEGLHRRGVNVLRVGICDPELAFSMEAHLAWYGYEARKGGGKGAQNDVISKADVVCATIIGSGMSLLKSIEFPFVVIDEAAQIIEPACLIPLSKGSVQVTMVGDQCQLPATVLSHEAQQAGLDVSLLDRLISMGMEVHMLSVQYRMHPLIAEFPSWRFYNHKLETGIRPEDRPVVTLKGMKLGSMAIIHVGATENSSGMSKSNEAEAQCVEYFLQAMKAQMPLADVGVITPYSAQVACIRKHLRILGPEGNGVQVSSVDAFQGSEKEAIILSMVRSNLRGDIGFVADWRRLNVAATRAKRLLVVIGNLVTLCQHDLWRDFLGFHVDLQVYEWSGHNLTPLSLSPSNLLAAARDISRRRGVKPLPLRGDYPVDSNGLTTGKKGTSGWDAPPPNIATENLSWDAAPEADLVGVWDDDAPPEAALVGDWDDAPVAEASSRSWDRSNPLEGDTMKLSVGPNGACLELATTRWGMRVDGVDQDSLNHFDVGSTIVAIEGVPLEQEDNSDDALYRVEDLFGSYFGDGASVVLAPQEEMLLGWGSMPKSVAALSNDFDLIVECCPKGLLVYGPACALKAIRK